MVLVQASDLESFFLDDTKYVVEDPLGRALAASCQLCHLSFVWLFSVGYVRRDLLDITTFLGAVGNAALGKILKATFRQQRPALTCELLGICHSYGMPSSHTQVMAFCCALHIALALSIRPLKPRPWATKLLQGLESAALAFFTATIAFARVYLGYHTPLQVVFGGIVGGITGFVWGTLAVLLLRRLGDIFTGWRFANALGISNVLSKSEPRAQKPSRLSGKHAD